MQPDVINQHFKLELHVKLTDLRVLNVAVPALDAHEEHGAGCEAEAENGEIDEARG